MLYNCAQDKALRYLESHMANINEYSAQFQLLVLDLIRKAFFFFGLNCSRSIFSIKNIKKSC